MYPYVVKVKGQVYAWGSNSLQLDLDMQLVLVLQNDPLGDPAEVTSEETEGDSSALGTIQPGECWTLPLKGLRGVSVTCATDTTLACAILVPPR